MFTTRSIRLKVDQKSLEVWTKLVSNHPRTALAWSPSKPGDQKLISRTFGTKLSTFGLEKISQPNPTGEELGGGGPRF
jgi:hypothetical protein